MIAERQKTDPNLKQGLDSPIRPYLPPWSANADAVGSIKFRELLEQSSGIRNHGNFDMTYSNLKTYFSKPVVPAVAGIAPCVGDDKANDVNGADPFSIITDKSYCYSNLNFAIFRILLPRIMGYRGDDEDTYAEQYVQIVRDRVFKPLGITDADCNPGLHDAFPNNDSYAFGYQFGGDTAGKDWGNRRRVCGGEGWYLSVEDLGLLLMSLNGADGRVLQRGRIPHHGVEPETCPRMGLPASRCVRVPLSLGGEKRGVEVRRHQPEHVRRHIRKHQRAGSARSIRARGSRCIVPRFGHRRYAGNVRAGRSAAGSV